MSNWVDSTKQAPYEFHLSKVLSKSLELPKNAFDLLFHSCDHGDSTRLYLDSGGVTMLGLIFAILVLWFVVVVISAGFCHFLQGAIYSEPTTGWLWKAPCVGLGVTTALTIWVWFDYSSPGLYRPLHELQSYTPENKKGSLKPEEGAPYPSLTITRPDGKKEVFTKQPGTKLEYRSKTNMPLPSTPLEVEVEEDGKKIVFKPERDAKGNFVRRIGESLIYRDDRNRQMIEGGLGALVISRPGTVFMGILLHILHFVAWFLCLWLLYDFQWPHAFGLGAVYCGVFTIFFLPMLLTYAEKVAIQRNPAIPAVMNKT